MTLEEEYALKLKYERMAVRALNALNSKVVEAFKSVYADSGVIVNSAIFQHEYEELLRNLYSRVSKGFNGLIDLPKHLGITEDESIRLSQTLVGYFNEQASRNGALITQTNQKNIQQSYELARSEPDATAEQIGNTAAGLLAAYLASRAPAIATTEVQNAAESTKGTEASILSVGSEVPTKEWVSLGDSHVRPLHVDADSRIVPVNEPFRVGGELMMYPRDASLGATAKNIINCRCSAVYDGNAIAAVRESQFPEQLMESIG